MSPEKKEEDRNLEEETSTQKVNEKKNLHWPTQTEVMIVIAEHKVQFSSLQALKHNDMFVGALTWNSVR